MVHLPTFSRRDVLATLAASSALTLIPGIGLTTEGKSADAGPYLFSYFKDNGQDGLHLAYSTDGLTWKALNGDKPLTSPAVGGKLMRDPSIVQGPDGVFHMVWSSGWADRGFGYASSKDLIHWSEHRYIPVNEKIAGANNTWAPDMFYDAATKQFIMVFATTIIGKFPETDKEGDQNHRQYAVMTKDFVTFSEPTLFFNPGYNCIDGTLFATDQGLTFIYKDERPKGKRLHAVMSAGIGKPWSQPGKPILERDWIEGPTVLKVGNVWRLYFDLYNKGRYGGAESKDGVHWEDISDKISLPPGARHGTAFAVSQAMLNSLLKLSQ